MLEGKTYTYVHSQHVILCNKPQIWNILLCSLPVILSVWGASSTNVRKRPQTSSLDWIKRNFENDSLSMHNDELLENQFKQFTFSSFMTNNKMISHFNEHISRLDIHNSSSRPLSTNFLNLHDKSTHIRRKRQNSSFNPFNNQLTHLLRHGHIPSAPRIAGRRVEDIPTTSLEWILEPALDLLFSNNTGGILHCQARSSSGATTVVWKRDDGQELKQVRHVQLISWTVQVFQSY